MPWMQHSGLEYELLGWFVQEQHVGGGVGRPDTGGSVRAVVGAGVGSAAAGAAVVGRPETGGSLLVQGISQ
jgi:hypothetical protein